MTNIEKYIDMQIAKGKITSSQAYSLKGQLKAIDAYVNDRKPVNGFLHNILSNDLAMAVCIAGDKIGLLEHITRYIILYVPNTIKGSKLRVHNWLSNNTPTYELMGNTKELFNNLFKN